MRRLIALGILACFLLSLIPAMTLVSNSDGFTIDRPEVESRIIPDSELTLPQVEALNSIGMGRATNSNWSATGGSDSNDEIYEMVFDSQGNVIICGSIYQVSQFGSKSQDKKNGQKLFKIVWSLNIHIIMTMYSVFLNYFPTPLEF